MNRRVFALLLGICMVMLNACGLLPEEEVYRASPQIQSYEQENFRLATVERGDMVLSASVSCAYMPVQKESLSFSVGGISFDRCFVEVGDYVEAGQLLAQLDMTGVAETLESISTQLTLLDLRISHVEENRALALKRKRLELPEGEALDEAIAQINKQYDLQKRSLQEERYLAQLQRQEYEKKQTERQLFAGISGMVTSVSRMPPGSRSTAGETVITVADSAASLFRASTPYWEAFTPGQEVVISTYQAEYLAIVTAETELGLPEQEKTPGEAAYVYFTLTTPALDLEDGDRGSLTLVLETRTDVLKVPAGAVSTAAGQTIVYYVDENGMKAYKPVTVGLRAENMLEILSGLTEGESIIVN